MKECKFEYDGESNSLIVYREDRRSYNSIDFGEIIVDLDKNMNLSAVEILNPDLLYGIPKKELLKISRASIKIQHRGQLFWIFVILRFQGVKAEKQLQIPIPLALERPIYI